MKIETDGIYDLIENAITDYQIRHNIRLDCNCFNLSLDIQKWIEDHYFEWMQLQENK